VIFPRGILHTTATLLLLSTLAFLVALAILPDRFVTTKHGRRRPLLSAAPAGLHDHLQKPYVSIQLLAWQALTAVYIAAATPLVAPLVAEWRLDNANAAEPMHSGYVQIPHGAQLLFWASTMALLLVFVGFLHRRLRRCPVKAMRAEPRWLRHAVSCCWIGGLVVLALSLAFLFYVVSDSAENQIFLWIRTSNWLSGVSPALPLVCFGLGVVATSWVHLRRMDIAATERRSLKPSQLFPSRRSGLRKFETRAARILEGRFIARPRRLAILAVGVCTVLLLSHVRWTVEAAPWTALMEILLGAVVIGLVHGLVLLAQTWHTTRLTLDQLAGHPVATTYRRLRESLAGMMTFHPFAAAPRQPPLEARIAACAAQLRTASATTPDLDSESIDVAEVLDASRWARPAGTSRSTFDLQTELVALQAVRALLRRVSAIRALILALTVDALVLLLSTRVYPFQPQTTLSALAWVLLLAVVAVCVWILLDMERNATLSHMSGSEPGKISWDLGFASQMIVYAGLPILALVASHFPEVGRPLLDWIRPVMSSVK
jgi:hypothetical protein